VSAFEPDALLVTLTVSPAIESAVVDWLLDRPESAGFTSLPVSGHSARLEGLSAVEQVTGRQRRVQFQVHMAPAALDGFLAAARERFGGTDAHYWVVPIMGGRRLSAAEATGAG
jgi:hypothetical protein